MTAARVLASQEQFLPLYQVVVRGERGVLSEVLSECLRNLTSIPRSLVPGLVERFKDTDNPTILIGLFDLLIQHKAGPQALEYLEESLVKLKDPDVFRYLLIALLSSRREALDDLVLRTAQFETDQKKIAVLLEALAVFDFSPARIPGRSP